MLTSCSAYTPKVRTSSSSSTPVSLSTISRTWSARVSTSEHVAANYLEGKKKEWEEYRTRVSSWEREKYIINY